MFKLGKLAKIPTFKIGGIDEEEVEERVWTQTHGVPHYAIRKMSSPPTMMSATSPKRPLDESHTPKLLKIHDGNIMRNVSATVSFVHFAVIYNLTMTSQSLPPITMISTSMYRT
ncbi:hypothetical protein ANCCAN_25481 [Ancylostoma caninum]|uniref:Uncharacterized protein n=1 Tax=Ancylostoma caninum TaxID=29170 RepID=A0A368F9E8_ANCCA|nr:hypothetical protein ANCCAN_25481 [Ancylostoma caninum]